MGKDFHSNMFNCSLLVIKMCGICSSMSKEEVKVTLEVCEVATFVQEVIKLFDG